MDMGYNTILPWINFVCTTVSRNNIYRRTDSRASLWRGRRQSIRLKSSSWISPIRLTELIKQHFGVLKLHLKLIAPKVCQKCCQSVPPYTQTHKNRMFRDMGNLILIQYVLHGTHCLTTGGPQHDIQNITTKTTPKWTNELSKCPVVCRMVPK